MEKGKSSDELVHVLTTVEVHFYSEDCCLSPEELFSGYVLFSRQGQLLLYVENYTPFSRMSMSNKFLNIYCKFHRIPQFL